MALHFWLIRHLGIHADYGDTSVFRRHAIRLGGASLLLFAVIGLLAALAPERLGYPPVAGLEMTKPFWPVLWVYGLENLLGAWGMVLGPAARDTPGRQRHRRGDPHRAFPLGHGVGPDRAHHRHGRWARTGAAASWTRRRMIDPRSSRR